MNIGAFEAKTHFSEIIEDVQRGKDFIITKRGKPVAKIIPFSESTIDRKGIVKILAAYQSASKVPFDIKEAIKSGRK
ncbi:antitoxin [Spirochaetia bacterium]|nr:antitoxin [Spirochaetia bacterium]